MHCPGVNSAKGEAELIVDRDLIQGELSGKIGGKNMTFTQFINAPRCDEY